MPFLSPSNIPGNFGFRNHIINGDMRIAQRGTSFLGLTAGQYTLDRWTCTASGATMDIAQLDDSDSFKDAGASGEFYLRYIASGSADFWSLRQKVENVWTLANKTATLSFFMHGDVGLTLQVAVVQNFDSVEADVTALDQDVTLDGNYTKYTFTFDVPAVNGKTIGPDSYLDVKFVSETVQNGTFRLTDVQLEEGPVATPFERRPLAIELPLCYRYYWQGSVNGGGFGRSYGTAGNNLLSGAASFPVTMRGAPAVVALTAGTLQNCTADVVNSDVYGFSQRVVVTANGQFRWYGVTYEADAEL